MIDRKEAPNSQNERNEQKGTFFESSRNVPKPIDSGLELMNPDFWNQIGPTWDGIGTVLERLFLGQISFSGDF